MKFKGNIDQLRQRLDQCGLISNERLLAGNVHQFDFHNWAVVNWWPSSGLLEFKGPKKAKLEVLAKYNMLDMTYEQAVRAVMQGLEKGDLITESKQARMLPKKYFDRWCDIQSDQADLPRKVELDGGYI